MNIKYIKSLIALMSISLLVSFNNISYLNSFALCFRDHNIFKVSFDDSMQPSIDEIHYYNSNFPKEKAHWKLAKELYEKYVLNKYNLNNNFTHILLSIPKIIHQIWLGSDFPLKHKKLQATWIKHHPDWTYKLWTDKDVEALNLHNKDFYDKAVTYAEKADIVRYEILYRFGGLYVDTDFECLKPFDIFHYNLDFYAGIEFNKNLRLNNALIAAKPHHPILKSCIEKMGTYPLVLKPNLTPRQEYIETLVQKTGPGHFTRMILEQKDYDRIVFFPNTYFYPFNAGKQYLAYSSIKPETFALHHWDMSWIKSKEISFLN